MNTEQIANFVYWITEHTNNRNADSYIGKDRLNYFKEVLLPEFLSKYPTGILTGWKGE